MEQRLNIEHEIPAVYKAMLGLAAAAGKSSLTPIQKELIKIRASQINSCAFCLDMHFKDALKIGETMQRIVLLDAWRETDLFTDEEKALLGVTEEVTLISNGGVSDKTFDEAKKYFSKETIAEIIMNTVVINSWNRIAVSSHTPIPK
jgi:AhpD family alkylhydroperoxidase